MTIVVVEQKIMFLCEYVQRLLVMDAGSIRFDGPVRQVVAHSGELEALGVHCPRVVTLCGLLQARGLDQGPPAITVEQAQAMVKEALA